MAKDPPAEHGAEESKDSAQGGHRVDLRQQLRLDSSTEVTQEEPETDWGSSKRSGIWLIFIVAMIVGALVTIGLWPEPPPAGSPTPKLPTETQPTTPQSATEELEEIKETVRAYMTADTDAARAKFIIAPEEALPKMSEFHERPDSPPPAGFGEILDVAPAAFDGLEMHMVAASEAEGDRVFLFSIFRIGKDIRIDWESSVGYGGMSWKRFLEEKPTMPIEMRVYLTPGTYYNGEHSDEDQWTHYKVRVKDHEGSWDAYAPKTTTTGQLLAAIVKPRARQPSRVFLRWADDREALEITRVLHPYWIDLDRLRSVKRALD